jgi:1-phosphofructokinase
VITTVTPNPSIDRTLHLSRYARGAVNRAHRVMVEPSGKGVNVALALAAVGVDVTAVLPVGGSSGPALIAMLDAAGLVHRDVPIAGAVRSNISLIEADGTTTKVNEPGPQLSVSEVDDVVAEALRVSSPGEWIAWCGSLPAGFGEDTLAAALARSRSAGRRVVLDSSGRALTTALDRSRGELPHVIKPNTKELAELVNRSLGTVGDVVDAAALLVERGVETVLVSLGADGAILVGQQVSLHGQAPVPRVINTVGAGDAFLAGYLAAADEPPAERLSSALRFGATAVQHHGTVLRKPDLSVRVHVRQVDPDRPLNEPAV